MEGFYREEILDDMKEYLEEEGDIHVDVSDVDEIEELFK